jgi:hypothetical protein
LLDKRLVELVATDAALAHRYLLLTYGQFRGLWGSAAHQGVGLLEYD